MIISELNYLEVQETEVFGGSSRHPRRSYPGLNTSYKKKVYADEYYSLVDYKVIDVGAWIYGNIATANAAADAHGYDSDAQTYSVTYTNDKFSSALSSSISATGY